MRVKNAGTSADVRSGSGNFQSFPRTTNQLRTRDSLWWLQSERCHFSGKFVTPSNGFNREVFEIPSTANKTPCTKSGDETVIVQTSE